MLNKCIAFIMALVIGNPMCCCAMVDLFAFESRGSTPTHSCCSSSGSFGDEQEVPKQPQGCFCFVEQEKIVSEVQAPSFRSCDLDAESRNSFDVTRHAFLLPCVSFVAVPSHKWPPGNIPVSSLRVRLAFQSSYLL